jgi:hypothetical protein
MKPNAPAFGINRRALLYTAALLPAPALLRITSARRKTRIANSPRGMMEPQSRQSSISYALRPTKRARNLCRPKNASRLLIRTARCGSSIPCTHKSSIALSVFQPRAQKSELKEREPFKTVLSGNRERDCRGVEAGIPYVPYFPLGGRGRDRRLALSSAVGN